MAKISYKYILLGVITFAFVIRFVGIKYGLPLWLIGDEPPFTLAALKMLELKSVLPGLNGEAFKPILYYSPYLSYIYLIPFTILLGIKYLLFNGGVDLFKNYIVGDLSHFFILARIINVAFGTVTVWLTYKIAKNIFKKEWIALFSAFFLASSVLHIHLSSVARDWVPAVFLFVLVIWILSKKNLPFKKKYIWSGVISGLSFGISLISGFTMVFVLFWYLFYEKNNFFKVFKEKILYISLFIFLALSALAIVIYPYGFHLSEHNSIDTGKTFLGYLLNFSTFLKPILVSEPVLSLFTILGLIFSWKNFKGYFWSGILFIFSYMTIFYIIFHYEHRFTIYFFPILSIFAGYGLYVIAKKIPNKTIAKIFIVIVLLLPFITSIRLEQIVLKNDSRIQVREWAETNIESNSKVLIYAEMTRFTSTKDAYNEQKLLYPNSLRKIDDAEINFGKNPYGYTQFHALNLYSIKDENFYKNLSEYAKKNNYQYLILDPFYNITDEKKVGFGDIIKNSVFIKSFSQSQEKYLLRDGNFGSPVGLFRLKSFGPRIEVYKINHD
ncbi:phospholipid carrier-dependent glycosyltransferase [Candidatus Woesearchaeota archaeon]|jgi:hypothetical protein|nr:phospholipid carrier-dependent glycosyltransferase [Candidatus Woesearchaeota archaeon]